MSTIQSKFHQSKKLFWSSKFRSLIIVHWFLYQLSCLFSFLVSLFANFKGVVKLQMYYTKSISKGVVFMSLEPTFDLCVTCGMFGFSWLVSIISFLVHSLSIGMVSSCHLFSSFFFSNLLGILAPPLHCLIYYILALVDPSPNYKQV